MAARGSHPVLALWIAIGMFFALLLHSASLDGLALATILLSIGAPVLMLFREAGGPNREWLRTPGARVGAKTLLEETVRGVASSVVVYGGRTTITVSPLPAALSIRRRDGTTVFEGGIAADMLLDAEMRAQIVSAQQRYPGLEIRDGKIIVSILKPVDEAGARGIVAEMNAIARPIIDTALAGLRPTADPAARLRAAKFTWHVPTFLALARDPTVDEQIRGEALRSVLVAKAPEATLELLREMLDTGVPSLMVAVATHAVLLGFREIAPDLSRRLASGGDPFATSAMLALETLGSAADAPAIAERLLSREPGVGRCAVRALGALGGVSAVPRIAEWRERNPADAPIATRAIDSIQSRLIGAGTGQLSIGEESPTGAVSLASGEIGRVSLARTTK